MNTGQRDEIGVAVQTWLWVRVELMAWYLSRLEHLNRIQWSWVQISLRSTFYSYFKSLSVMNIYIYICICICIYIYIYIWYIYIYIIYVNLPTRPIVRNQNTPSILGLGRRGNPGHKTFLADYSDKKIDNYDKECSNHHPFLSTLRSKGLSCNKIK